MSNNQIYNLIHNIIQKANKVKRIILDNSVATEQELKEIEKKIRAEIEKDIEKIKADPLPAANELYTHIYANNEPHYIRGIEYEQSVTDPKH